VCANGIQSYTAGNAAPDRVSTGDKQGGWSLFLVGTLYAIANPMPKIVVAFSNSGW